MIKLTAKCYKYICILSAFALICYLGANTAQANTHDLPQVTILAASSISEPLTEISRIYSREHNVVVTTSFDGTAELANKIEQGEQADIFISSHQFWMADLKQKGLVDVYSLSNLVQNKLALVVSTKSYLSTYPTPGKSFAAKLNYLNRRSIMVMGDFNTSALGRHTAQALQNYDTKKGTRLWRSLNNKIIPSISAKSTLYLIANGETAGIVYYSDAYNNDEVSIVDVIDTTLHDPIIYQAAVVAGENMTIAREFLIFLQSSRAKQIYKKYGFIVD